MSKAMVPELLPFDQSCTALEVSSSTLKRMLKAGAPQARKGRAGRGGGALCARLQLLAARSGMTMPHYIRALVRREIQRQAFSALQDLTDVTPSGAE